MATTRGDETEHRPVQDVRHGRAYDRDFYGWTIDQAAALRAGRFEALDLENLVDEIESLGKEEFSKLRDSFQAILVHMLTWDHQPESRTRNDALHIRLQRLDIENRLSDNLSLHERRGEAVAAAFRGARIEAAGRMDRPERLLPAECLYSLDEILERPFDWPDT